MSQDKKSMSLGDPTWSPARELQGYEINELHGTPARVNADDAQGAGINEIHGRSVSELPAYRY